MFSLQGKKALIIGIANENSIAYGCAKALRAQGADLAVTYQNEKAEKYVRPLAEGLSAEIIAPLDVRGTGSSPRCSTRSASGGAGSIPACTRSPSARRRTCTRGWSIARARASASRWTSRCIRSSAWCAGPSR